MKTEASICAETVPEDIRSTRPNIDQELDTLNTVAVYGVLEGNW